MKRVLLALAFVVCLPWHSWAQDSVDSIMAITAGDPVTDGFPLPGCGGTIQKPNTSWQTGWPAWMLHYDVETSIDLNVCIVGVGVAAFVEGLSYSGYFTTGLFTAVAARDIPVNSLTTYNIDGAHIYVPPILSIWLSAGNSHSAVTLVSQGDDSGDGGITPPDCGNSNAYYYDESDNRCVPINCPIVINLDGTGSYHLTSPADGVLFDLDADKALEHLAWTPADSSLAFLALDRNGNGQIDSGAELFGNHAPVIGGRSTAVNGFEALKFQLGPGVTDDTLDARSPAWFRLLLWVDRNHDGISQPDELTRIADSGIVAINLTYKTENRRDAFGNLFHQRAEITWADGHKQPIYDVWLTQAK